MPHTFTLSDESINSYGFWVKTSGIDLSQFKKNPVMLYDHNRYGLMPIGKWENIRVEDEKLLADAVFDRDDDLAVKIEKKVDNGYIRGASIGISASELSDGKENIKPGQMRPTVSKSLLYEASITPFPSNQNALKLKHGGKTISLSDGAADIDSVIPNFKPESMKEVKKMLGLGDSATEKEVTEALGALQKNNERLCLQRETLFVKLGESTGSITDANRDRMIRLAKTDFDLALDFAMEQKDQGSAQSEAGTQKEAGAQSGQAQAPQVQLADVLKSLQTPPASPKSYRELAESEPETLQKLYHEDFGKFNQLYKAEYGRDYRK